MSAKKTERLLNLVICLLATRRHLTVEQIRDAVPGYQQGGPRGGADDEAFRRMFERDKEELRDLGIPLVTGSDSVWDDEVGYRIDRRDYELPDIRLEPDEAAAVGLAARLWQSARFEPAASSALLKLRAAGIEADPAASAGLEPRVEATEAAFEPCLAATRAGQVITFEYRSARDANAATRRIEPWGVVSWRGRWYVVGHDLDRDARRVFRLSRVTGSVRPLGPAGAVRPPEGVDLIAQVAAVEAADGDTRAVLRVRSGRALALRRQADCQPGRPPLDGWDELELRYADPEQLAAEVASFGADAVVVAPPELRDAVVRRLRAVAERSTDRASDAGAGARSDGRVVAGQPAPAAQHR